MLGFTGGSSSRVVPSCYGKTCMAALKSCSTRGRQTSMDRTRTCENSSGKLPLARAVTTINCGFTGSRGTCCDIKDSHQRGEDVVVVAHLLQLLLDCIPAPVQNIRELGLLRHRIQIFELKIALLVYYLLGIPQTQVEM